jgi:hypothetical protein
MFSEQPGSFESCEICYWEDDLMDLEKMYEPAGPNKISLEMAQKNFIQLGAKEGRFIGLARAPLPDDRKEEKWRLLDRSKDFPRELNSRSGNFKEIYYWYWA